jgi:hypothetical protein
MRINWALPRLSRGDLGPAPSLAGTAGLGGEGRRMGTRCAGAVCLAHSAREAAAHMVMP